jgi:hypothetical protein
MESVELKNKVGVGIITCDEESMYNDLLGSFPYDRVGGIYVYDLSKETRYVKHNKSVKPIAGRKKSDTIALAKNKLVKQLLKDGFEHIFIINDGIIIKDGDVFNEYIETARDFGMLGGMSYAWSGANVDLNGIPIIKNHIMGHNGRGVAFCHNFPILFTYYDRVVFDEIGFFDETMGNTWGDLDFYYRMSKASLTSLWWWFPDITDSKKYIDAVSHKHHSYVNIGSSKLTKSADLDAEINLFINKHNYSPLKMKHPNEFELLGHIRHLIDNYATLRGKNKAQIDNQENSSPTVLSGQ